MNDEQLLSQNAWLLMDWRNAIRAHEDWCKIAVNVRNGPGPRTVFSTVGAYLEYWEGNGCVECGHDFSAVKEGVSVGSLGLVCHYSGNPGTGSNCSIVAWGNGAVTRESLRPFSDIAWGYIAACRNNRPPEVPVEHDLAWLIEQVKSLKSK